MTTPPSACVASTADSTMTRRSCSGRARRRARRRSVRSPRAAAFCLEILQAALQLRGHLVERASELRELVATANLDAFLEPAGGDRVRGVCEPTERADDRAAREVGDAGDQEQRAEQADQQAPEHALLLGCDHRAGRDRRQHQRALGHEPGSIAGTRVRRSGGLDPPWPWRRPGDLGIRRSVDPRPRRRRRLVRPREAGPVAEPVGELRVSGTEATIIAERSPGPTSAIVVSAALAGTRPTAKPSGVSTRSGGDSGGPFDCGAVARASAAWKAGSRPRRSAAAAAAWRSSSNAASAALRPASSRSSTLLVTLRSATALKPQKAAASGRRTAPGTCRPA